MEPKQQEIVQYQVFPFASFSILKADFLKMRKVVSWKFDVTTDDMKEAIMSLLNSEPAQVEGRKTDNCL